MINGTYFNPTVYHFGAGAGSLVGVETRKSAARILFHYGRSSIRSNGIYAAVKESLERCGVEVHELGGVAANPKADLVYEGIDQCRKHGIGFVLAVGGGSVIDSAKAISIGVPYDGDFYDFYNGKATPSAALKIGAVLTIPGAGSESSSGSVISNGEEKNVCDHTLLHPTFAILDPEYTLTVPRFETSCGIVDAMSHIFERYFTNTDHVDCTDRICEGLLLSLIRGARMVAQEPDNCGIRSEVMWASKLAHDQTPGFGRKQDWGCHKIAHEIGALFELPHGAVMGVVFLAWFKWIAERNNRKLIQLGQRVFGIGLRDGDSAAYAAIEQFERFLLDIEMPTSLKALGVGKEHFPAVASRAVRFMRSGTIGNYVRLSPDEIVALLQTAYG